MPLALAAVAALVIASLGVLLVRQRRVLLRLEAALAALERQHASVEPRLLHRHRTTGLPTREPLLEAMAQGSGGTLGVVAFVDFDRMCAFDAALGEQAMVILVGRMQRMLSRERLIAHVDRSHFAIWFAGVEPEVATAELEALAYALGDTIELGDAAILPQVRSSSARLPEDGASPDAVLTRSLAALSHGGPVSEALNPIAAARDRYEIEQDLRQAIARGEFEMLYQPLIDAGAGRVIGAEALLRWEHPTRGTISPTRFVPVAEAIGLADEVGLWALNTACREVRRWHGVGLDGMHVAVNASGHQLDRADMVALIGRTLARHGLAADSLEIELTETVAAGDIARAARLFDEMRAMGVRIAIDDFGTGYSSMSALRQLAFDKIKIDREFVTDVADRSDSQAICQSIVALGRGLGIRVLAEGVERAQDYRWLRAHGCNHFQGYYFAPPLTSVAFEAFARDRSALAALLDTSPNAVQTELHKRLSA